MGGIKISGIRKLMAACVIKKIGDIVTIKFNDC